MGNAAIIGIDLAKQVFQLHGADAQGQVVFRKRLSRAGLKQFLTLSPPCCIGMEAGPGAHYWARLVVFQFGSYSLSDLTAEFNTVYV
jgi:transposase